MLEYAEDVAAAEATEIEYQALYYEEKQRLYKRLYKQGYRGSHLGHKVNEGLERKQENA